MGEKLVNKIDSITKLGKSLWALWTIVITIIGGVSTVALDYSDVWTDYQEHLIDFIKQVSLMALLFVSVLWVARRDKKEIIELIEFHKAASEKRHDKTALELKAISNNQLADNIERAHHHYYVKNKDKTIDPVVKTHIDGLIKQAVENKVNSATPARIADLQKLQLKGYEA